MSSTSKHNPERKEQILREATRLFSKTGYDGASMKELAGACGITEPALYRHFDSKDAIYTAVLDSLQTRLRSDQLFKKMKEEWDIEIILRELARLIISFARENDDVYRLMLFAALGGHRKAREVFGSIRGTCVSFLEQKLTELHRKKLIRKVNNAITARCFVGMVFDCGLGFTLWKGYHGRQFEPQEVIDNNVPIYARGLKREDG